MDSNSTVNLMLWICVAIAGIIIFFNPLKKLLKFILNGLFGIIIIYLYNTLFAFLGVNVGINIFTVLISAFLGIPGVIVVFAIQAIL